MQPSFLPGYQHHALASTPSLAADEAEPFGRGRLDRTRDRSTRSAAASLRRMASI